MEWITRLNESLKYIEENLADTIDVEEAAKLACCSSFHYQRMFAYMTGAPLSEYIRKRRMTLAATDLTDGEKVIDVAVKYGYESPTAFNRAFKNVHGINPSKVRKAGVSLKAYPSITFSVTIKGDVEMDYRIEKRDEIRIVGIKSPLTKDVEENFKDVPKMWAKASMTGKVKKLQKLMNEEPMGVLGVSACYGDEEWAYYIAVATDAKTPKGMDEYTIPPTTWAVFPGSGTMPDSIQTIERSIFTEWLPTSGYEYGEAPDIELYLNADPKNAKFEIWMPVKKKSE